MAMKNGDYDIREDEEQEVKEGECLQLLVSAGYFRARIRGLATFDKIVGGLCWCIRGCNVDIDVDLLFHENLTIGQKIALTEKIVRSLRRMECPHAIEPHQIQGRDYRHVFPVVQWLVKRVIGRRDEMTAAWRQLAVTQYNIDLQQPEQQHQEREARAASCQRVQWLRHQFPPRRRLRKPDSFRSETSRQQEELQTRTTMLEYGVGVVAGASSSGESGAAGEAEAKAKSSTSPEAQMDSASENRRLAASLVGSIVGLHAEQVVQAVRDYGEKQQRLQHEASSFRDPRQLRDALRCQLEAAAEQAAANAERRTVAEAKRSQLLQQRGQANDEAQQLRRQLQECPRADRLVAARQREAEFKAECREASSNAQAELQRLRDKLASGEESSAGAERVAKVEQQLGELQARLLASRQRLAATAQACASLKRKIDEFPSQEEVSQYIRRLMELAEQASVLHKQTKQFYTLYNSVTSLRQLVEREIQLLTSIEDNFRQTERSQKGREELAAQLDKIVENARQNQALSERKTATEKSKRDSFNEEYLALVEAERRYNRLVRDFRNEAAKSQRLGDLTANA